MFQLRVTDGPSVGWAQALEAGRTYKVGRDAQSCDLAFQDGTMSRLHAELTWRDGGWVLANRSPHGVLVGEAVEQGEVPLGPGAAFVIGGTSFVLEAVGAPAGGVPALAGAGPATGGAAAGPGWALPLGCSCISMLGCAPLAFGLVMGISFALWEARIQRSLRGDDTAVLAAIVAPIASLGAGLLALVVMRLFEVRRAKARAGGA